MEGRCDIGCSLSGMTILFKLFTFFGESWSMGWRILFQFKSSSFLSHLLSHLTTVINIHLARARNISAHEAS